MIVKSVNVLLELNAVTAQYRLARNSIKRISRIFVYLNREITVQITWGIFWPSATIIWFSKRKSYVRLACRLQQYYID